MGCPLAASRCGTRRRGPVWPSRLALPHAQLSPLTPLTAQQVLAPRPVSRGVRCFAVKAEISYVMVKPDGVQRGLVGDIISRFERKGFKLVGLKLYQTPQQVAEEHYKELSAKPFYPKLVEYIVSGPVVAMVRRSRMAPAHTGRGRTHVWPPLSAGHHACLLSCARASPKLLRTCCHCACACAGVGGRGRGRFGAQAHRRHQPAGGGARHHPRRLCH